MDDEQRASTMNVDDSSDEECVYHRPKRPKLHHRPKRPKIEEVSSEDEAHTEQRNEHMRAPATQRNGKPILVWKMGESEAEAVEYPSLCNAQKTTGTTNLHMVANGRQNHAGGFCAKWAPPPETQDDLPGEGHAPTNYADKWWEGYDLLAEEWRDVEETLRVSSRGRVQQRRRSKWGYRYTPRPTGNTASLDLKIQVNGKDRLLHHVIFDAFFPGVRNGRDIDHIDKCLPNCNLSNLRPMTHNENRKKRTPKDRRPCASRGPSLLVSKAVRGRPVGTVEWTLHASSQHEAARELARILGQEKVDSSRISEALRIPRPYRGWELELA